MRIFLHAIEPVQHGCKVISDTFCSGIGEERTARRPGSD